MRRYLLTRLPDDDGSARIELQMTFANDQNPPVKNQYTLKRDFALDRRTVSIGRRVSLPR